MKIKKILFLLICTVCVFGHQALGQVNAAINFTVTPIRYEYKINPGESVSGKASIRNNGSGTVVLPITKSDFTVRDSSGVPKIVRKSELVYPDQQLSTWISLSETSVELAPGEEKSIDFTIQVPENATPGGHYGAVLFQNQNSGESSQKNIGINVDYGVIILVEVSGEIHIELDIQDPIIRPGGSGGGKIRPNQNNDTPTQNPDAGSSQENTDNTQSSSVDNPENRENIDDSNINNTDNTGNIENTENTDNSNTNNTDIQDTQGDEEISSLFTKDECRFGDRSGSAYDGRCNPWDPVLFSDDDPLLFEDDEFEILFSLPIENLGNTHVKPTGKITLRDENGDIIPGVGKEVIGNEFGAVLREEIVDYLPINDHQGNILPQSKRIYDVSWKGFPYQSYNERGEVVTNYWTPSAYYSMQAKRESGYIYPWEIVTLQPQSKNISANIQVEYQDAEGNDVVFNSAKEFPIEYMEEKIIINPYVIMSLFFGALSLIFAVLVGKYIIFTKKTHKKCWHCKKKIQSHWATCPHCGTPQDKKKHKEMHKKKGQ